VVRLSKIDVVMLECSFCRGRDIHSGKLQSTQHMPLKNALIDSLPDNASTPGQMPGQVS